jgi:hypothetical protein
VPSTSPARVATVAAPPTTLAMPKSVTLSTFLAENIMFSGFTSRWSTPWAWA